MLLAVRKMSASSSSVAALADTLHQVYLGIGSNIDARRNIKSALQVLKGDDKKLLISETYRCEAVGFEGPPFLNLVVGFLTDKDLGELSRDLKRLEQNHGRTKDLRKFSSRTLDIDILTYDSLQGLHQGIQLPRPEISYNAYVLRPFAELAPELLLPGSNNRLMDLWHDLKVGLENGLDKISNENLGKTAHSLVRMSICW